MFTSVYFGHAAEVWWNQFYHENIERAKTARKIVKQVRQLGISRSKRFLKTTTCRKNEILKFANNRRTVSNCHSWKKIAYWFQELTFQHSRTR